MLVENNLIIYGGKVPKEEEWHHQTEKARYDNNLYCNYKNIPEEDQNAVTEEQSEKVILCPGSGPEHAKETVHERQGICSAFEGFRLCEESPARGKGKKICDCPEKDFLGNPSETEKNLGAC